MKIKKRLDQLLLERYPHLSRSYVQSLIMQGKVCVEQQVITKPGTPIVETAAIDINQVEPKFVSRAGYKLEAALAHFAVPVFQAVVLDAGLSTGGFTDCLLQQGAARIYGVDVGYGQVHEKIRKDPRVVIMERTNLRLLDSLPELIDGVTLDLSFISILKVIDSVQRLLKKTGWLVTLIKPQFEAERDQVGSGGIVRDPAVHASVVQRVCKGIEAAGFICRGVIDSPIHGTDGNKEFLAFFQKKGFLDL